MIGKSNIGGENLNAQLTAQETLIQTITESLVGKATLANATADKILEGFCAYVGQQLIQGTLKPVNGFDISLMGCTKFAVDKFTFSGRTATTVESSHSLGEIPKFAFLIANGEPSTGVELVKALIVSGDGSASNCYITYNNSSNPRVAGGYPGGLGLATNSTVKIETYNTTAYYAAGVEYTLITLA